MSDPAPRVKVAFETTLHREPTFGVRLALWQETALKDAETVLDRRHTIKIEFGYALSALSVFEFTRDGPWTRKDFVDAVVATYRELPGADMTDLWLETAYVGRDGVWHLGMGS
jgi:hypothetical protein